MTRKRFLELIAATGSRQSAAGTAGSVRSARSSARARAKLGLSADECRRLVVWGCFEWLPPEGNYTSSCNINLVKPVEQMLKDAKDGKLGELATFDDFKREYFARLGTITDKTRKIMDFMERDLAEINPSLILTLGIGHALETGRDAFSTGMRYNHTEMAGVAFASTVDSLVAVKELVYEREEGRGKSAADVEGAGGDPGEELGGT